MNRNNLFVSILVCAIFLFTVLTFVKVHESDSQPENVEWIYDIVVTQTVDGCPCAYEVWSTYQIDGIIQDKEWYIFYTQDDCWNISDGYLERMDSLNNLNK